MSFQYSGILQLPIGEKYIGSRIIVHNGTYPPYTRTSTINATMVRINPNGLGIVGYYPSLSTDNMELENQGLSSFTFIGGVVELLGVPSSDGADTQWVLLNGHNCILSTIEKSI